MDRNSSSFMVVNFPLDTELDGFDGLSDLGAGNTIVFTTIPAGVKVFFAIDNNSQSKIEALQGMQIQTNHGGIYFTTVGTSPEPMILAHWSSDDMKIITPPISTFESLNGFGLTAFEQLDKAMNPFSFPAVSIGSYSVNAVTNLLSKTLSCKKIKLTLSINPINPAGNGGTGVIRATLNGVIIISSNASNGLGNGASASNTVEIFTNIGDSLIITSAHIDTTFSLSNSYILEEYTLKA